MKPIRSPELRSPGPGRLGWMLVVLALIAGCKSPAKTGSAAEPRYLFFPFPPAEPRVQFLTAFSDSSRVEPPRSALERFTLGEDTTPPRRLNKPYGLAVRDGVVYVCDSKALNITRIDFKNHTYTYLGTHGPGRVRKPINMVIDPLGFKFVADGGRQQVLVFGPDDRYVKAFDIPPPSHPVDVACHGDELYVLDNYRPAPRIVVLERTTGKVLRTFGRRGKDPGEFRLPSSLCVDPEGYLYVSDTVNNRIQKLTRDGKVVWTRGEAGRHIQQFGRPRGVRAGPDGIIFVVEGAMELVKMYNAKGQILMFFGGPGDQPGALLLPSSLAVDATSISYFKRYLHKDFKAKYLLFVASQYGPRLINVYAFGSFPEGTTLSDSEYTTLPSLPTPGPSRPPKSPTERKRVPPAGGGIPEIEPPKSAGPGKGPGDEKRP